MKDQKGRYDSIQAPVQEGVDAQLKERLLFPTSLRRFSTLVIDNSNLSGWCNVNAVDVSMEIYLRIEILFKMHLSVGCLKCFGLFQFKIVLKQGANAIKPFLLIWNEISKSRFFSNLDSPTLGSHSNRCLMVSLTRLKIKEVF